MRVLEMTRVFEDKSKASQLVNLDAIVLVDDVNDKTAAKYGKAGCIIAFNNGLVGVFAISKAKLAETMQRM